MRDSGGRLFCGRPRSFFGRDNLLRLCGNPNRLRLIKVGFYDILSALREVTWLSASYVASYPQLLKTLATEQKIVYLCGAGASMSLGGHRLSWPNWILAGKHYLTSYEQDELDRRIGAWTTNELIDAVTFLLQKLKASGDYDAFMASTVASLHPTSEPFKAALQKVWRSGDLIATTNYDLTIEEAVDAQSVSYSTPAEIFSVIRGEANKVIHLHGVYDRLNGNDDIVADDPQYRNILANAGAQFIQNLISTHPLIIVGCGGTVEDPNLSGFMSFVVDKLGLTDVPYFYLMKNGDTVPSLPANAIPVFYGDSHADLPVFLSELAMLRLQRRAGLRTLAAINPYQDHTIATSAFGRMHFSNGFNAFIGREEELKKLNGFLEAPKRFSWWSIIGDGGIGKSRLVLEWLRSMPTRWFGFFTYKRQAEARAFKPFTDTVIVFDYVLGKEHECVEVIQAYLDAFCGSPYHLRFLFIERNLGSGETDWLRRISRGLEAQYRVEFEAGSHTEPLTVRELTVAEEIVYVDKYLQSYLPLLPASAFVEECRGNTALAGQRIEEAFRASVDPTCFRPLYLSIFTEVWISKEGRLSLDSIEDLLSEYLNKEKNRWKLILGTDELVDAYLRILAVACAIGYYNITDVYGNNYLEEDAKRLTAFFDGQSGKPGANNVFMDLFVSMDELVEDDGEDDVIEAFFHPGGTSALPDDEMDEDDRFAHCAPYIKLQADPNEVYLNMLANVGAAEEDELKALERVREERIKRVDALPDHAWIVKPVFPDIIKAFIVSYVVNDRDVVRFTKLARSNSILGLADFLTRALEDWEDSAIFQRMAITPPDEMLNYFEYYVSLLIRIDKIDDIKSVEQALIDSDPCFPKYELELWRRIAVVLTDRGNANRLYDSACWFIDYLNSLEGMMTIRDGAADIIRAYSVGLHNAGEIDKHSAFLERCAELKQDNQKLAEALCESYRYLVNAKLYKGRDADVQADWIKTVEILKRYHYPLDMCKTAMDTAYDYMRTLIQRNDLGSLRRLAQTLEALYEAQHIADVADIAAFCSASIYTMSYAKDKRLSSEAYEKVEKYHADFPGSMQTRAAILSVWSVACLETSFYRKVPEKMLKNAKAWAALYPNEIEFKKGYFGLLLARLEYAQANDERNEQRRLFKEMKSIAESTDYAKYSEESDLLNTVNMLQRLYGY